MKKDIILAGAAVGAGVWAAAGQLSKLAKVRAVRLVPRVRAEKVITRVPYKHKVTRGCRPSNVLQCMDASLGPLCKRFVRHCCRCVK